MSIFLLSLVLAAAPKPPPAPPSPLPTISAPLGHFGAVIEPAPKAPVADQERMVSPAIPQCTPQAVYLMRFLGGMARVIEQLQQWLDLSPGLEAKLFKRKAILGEVMKHLSAAAFEEKKSCGPLTLGQGFQVELDAPPKKFCPVQSRGDFLGEYWFFTGKKPAAVISVSKGDPDPCVLRLSSVLFDAKGVARVRVHGDWGTQISVTLNGDKCKKVDFSFDPSRQVFVPDMKSCKR
ncbi:MAG: hypothetical protein IT380_14610 [Myxococcales bacterium]|nr:hypothetical protein [Myxococcales bacterium]